MDGSEALSFAGYREARRFDMDGSEALTFAGYRAPGSTLIP